MSNIEKKEKKTRCYTYFHIYGKNFDPEQLKKALGLSAFRSHSDTDTNRAGKTYNFSTLSICYVEDYNVYLYKMMEKTIEPLWDKIDLLNELREKYNLKYYINVVPHIYTDEITPVLSPSLKVMDFCHLVRAEIDIDYYIYDQRPIEED